MKTPSLTHSPIPRADFLLTRRYFGKILLSATCVGALVGTPGPALALDTATAHDLVSKLVDEINAVIGSGRSDDQMIRQFEQIFVRYADVPFMARYALGADGRGASDAQMKAFIAAFQGYISRKYGQRFREFIGGRLEVVRSRAIKSFFEVRTMVYLQGMAPFDVTFQLSNRSGDSRFVNIFIEGVNLLLTERTEIGALLDRRGGSIEKLTRDLRDI
jgi:phospholipid transport system substrate-binding protein